MHDIPVIREEKMFVITPNQALKKNTMEIEKNYLSLLIKIQKNKCTFTANNY